MLYKDQIAEYDHLIKSFNEAYKSDNLKQLNVLIEYVRSEGVLYADYDEKQAVLFNLMLNISLKLLEKPEAQDSNELWWFVCQLYDVVFHQVRLTEYPTDCVELYRELTANIQDSRYNKLKKEDNKVSAYSSCLYFIELIE